jgi:hypothetical protein
MRSRQKIATHDFVVETLQLLFQSILGRRLLRQPTVLAAEAPEKVDS